MTIQREGETTDDYILRTDALTIARKFYPQNDEHAFDSTNDYHAGFALLAILVLKELGDENDQTRF